MSCPPDCPSLPCSPPPLLCLPTTLESPLTSQAAPHPPPPPDLSLFQFLGYFVYLLVLSIAYFLGAVLGSLWHFQCGHHQPLPLAQELTSLPEEKAAQVLSLQDGTLSNLQPIATTLAPKDST